jgi:hypothetical protein
MKSNNFAQLRNIITFCLMFTVFAATSLIVSAAPEKSSSMGELIVSGKYINGVEPSVMLNGETAYNGRTFFSTGMVATPNDTNAVLKLGKLGYINVAPNSVLSLNFDNNSISGTLSSGNIKVVNNEGVKVTIQTTDKTFTNKAEGNGVFTVNINSDITSATSEVGSLYLVNGANTIPVQDDDDATVSNGSAAVPVIILGGLVAVAAIYIFTRGDDNQGAFVSTTN